MSQAPRSRRGLLEVSGPGQMLEDLQAVAQLSEETIDEVVAMLAAFPGTLVPDQLVAILRETIADDDLASSLARTLHNIDADELTPVLEFLSYWRTQRPENAEALNEDTLRSLEAKLTRLVQNRPAIVRYRKARRLATLIGPVARRIEIICDCRPVFDESRNRVEAMTPLSILRISYADEEDELKAFEVLIPSKVLGDLVAKGEQAQRKLEVLRKSIKEWIPDGLADVV